MKRNSIIFVFILLLAAQPALADSKIVSGKKFISLTSERIGIPSAVIRPSQVQRSDIKAIRSGFMRIDRDLVITTARRPNVVRATEAAPAQVAMLQPNDTPVVTRGSAVTDLFGDNGGADSPVFGETKRTTNTPSYNGHIWPIASNVKQKVSSGYGMRKDPFHGKMRFHGGIDIAAAAGTPIMASAEGIVKDVTTSGGLGRHITIAHSDGSESTYGHLSAQSVREGQRVTQGQAIGKLGSTGRSTGPHLDYRIKHNGQRIDPMLVLNAPKGVTTRVAQVVRVR